MSKSKVETIRPNVEQLAAQAKLRRQEEAAARVNEVLRASHCSLQIVVALGNQFIPIAQVLALPCQVLVVAGDVPSNGSG